MATKARVIPQKFVATDGSEWPTEAEAERQNAMVEALEEFERARNNLLKAIAETHRTADGHLFRTGIADRYFVLCQGIAGPEIAEAWISCPYYNRKIEVDQLGRVFVIDDRDHNHRCAYQIKELYKSRSAAEEEWTKRRREWVKEQIADLRRRRSDSRRR